MTTTKEKAPVSSMNLWTSVVTVLIAAIFTSQGIEVDFTAEQLVSLFYTKEGIALATSLFMLLFTPVYKTIVRFAKEGFNWAALKSKNLVAHLIALLAIILGLWLDSEQIGFAIAGVTELMNYIAHRFKFAA